MQTALEISNSLVEIISSIIFWAFFLGLISMFKRYIEAGAAKAFIELLPRMEPNSQKLFIQYLVKEKFNFREFYLEVKDQVETEEDKRAIYEELKKKYDVPENDSQN